MFVHNIDPVFFTIFGLEVRYYGLVYFFGFLFLLWFLNKKRKSLELTKEQVYDFVFYLIIGAIVGSRLFEVLFYNPVYYFNNLSKIIALWEGGMSFHGGLVGAVIVSLIFCKKNKKDFYKLADIIVLPLACFLFLGRIANFINGEIVGKITNFKYAVKFPNYEGYRYPTQLFEAFKNLVIFFILLPLKNLKKGVVFYLFIILYSFFRFFIEFYKEPSAVYLGVSLGHLFCVVFFVVGVVGLYKVTK
ncbi:MAG: prolipoprotein diacylglyceryl transferase [Nanoarchaeota archaeon]|nr:prolipoprotein diacylglyceryl transferase [Nanoarchaeota archaeon]